MPSPIPIAIIANSPTPYRLYLHQRLVDELPQYQLWSVFTHEVSNAPWRLPSVQRIRPVQFGAGESSENQDKASRQFQEWFKGGRIISWMAANLIRAVVLFGYNDMVRIRILLYCRRVGIPCFVFGDGNIKSEVTGSWKNLLKRMVLPLVLRLASGGLCCGSLGRQYFEHYGMRKIYHFPYESNYQLIQSMTEQEVKQATARLQLPEGRRLLLYCGRLVSVKRVDLLAEAFQMLAQEREQWDLLLVGDGPEKAMLEKKLGAIGDRVHWIGFVDDEQLLAAIYRRADALVLPSDYEPWGVVVTEGAAAGLALVASSVVGAAADLLISGRNGQSFERGHVNSLLQALRITTADETIDMYKAASIDVLAEWRAKCDPVQGLMSALTAEGIV